MPIIMILFYLVIIGLAIYLVETYVPMTPPIKVVIRVVVVLALVLWLLQTFHITGPVIK
jgi:hypothetical protein